MHGGTAPGRSDGLNASVRSQDRVRSSRQKSPLGSVHRARNYLRPRANSAVLRRLQSGLGDDALLQPFEEPSRLLLRLRLELRLQAIGKPPIHTQRLRALAERRVTAHEALQRLLVQLVASQDAAIRLRRL